MLIRFIDWQRRFQGEYGKPTIVSEANDKLNQESIVFFDGVCGLCNRTINLLMAIDSDSVLKFAPLQGTTAAAIIPPNVRESLNTFVFSDGGRLSYRSSALVKILIRIGGLWKLLGLMLWLIPSPLRDLGYRVVSRLRYQLFGKTDACRLPTPEERQKFLD